ncbi:MAG: CAP domain-containing protein [Candidatus Caenarcaniphilales bacterium]|nr:CAP domain-containing protein [Candidatus Caenarcaniphilales bacterium]
MQKFFLLILLLIISCTSSFMGTSTSKAERITDSIIDPNNFDSQRLEFFIHERVNQIRDSYNVAPLELETKLQQAAASQAENMKNWNRVSHHQISLSKFSLTNRVQYFNIKNKHVGENVADVYLDVPMKVNFASDILVVKTYKETADALVLSWKYSPGHFKNMTDPDFKYTGIKVQINPSKKTVYAAQVFGSEI